MADILKKARGESYPGGIKTPSQMKTITGPGVRTDNMIGAKKQATMRVGKKG